MANVVNLIMNGPAAINRHATVELVHQVSGKKVQVSPYLDGTASIRGLAEGAWTMRVMHPNYTFPIHTQDIRVFGDRPTHVPIVIPPNLLTFSKIEDLPDANLGPVQAQLDAAQQVAARQATKKGGEPIYAADWNELADAAADIAVAANQMTRLVAPQGHNHPELEKKIAELDSNLQKFFDIFGRSIVELQRQIQQLALQRKVDDALSAAKVPVEHPVRDAIFTQFDKLIEASHDPPAVYTRKVQEVGRTVEQALSGIAAPGEERAETLLKEASVTAGALTMMGTVLSYREEAENLSRVGKAGNLNLRTAAKVGHG